MFKRWSPEGWEEKKGGRDTRELEEELGAVGGKAEDNETEEWWGGMTLNGLRKTLDFSIHAGFVEAKHNPPLEHISNYSQPSIYELNPFRKEVRKSNQHFP